MTYCSRPSPIHRLWIILSLLVEENIVIQVERKMAILFCVSDEKSIHHLMQPSVTEKSVSNQKSYKIISSISNHCNLSIIHICL